MTTTFMMEAVKAGVGRETAHEIIKEHAVATVNDLRTGEVKENNLVTRLGADDRFPLDEATLASILETSQNNAGAAPNQIAHFQSLVASAKKAHPEAADYVPGSIL
jgi:adenylosuccinate lyase